MQTENLLQSKIERISNLPTLPQLASHLMKALNDPNASTTQIAALVSRDISLSAKILRLANSAFYGIPRTITNINNAVVILGYKVINTLVLSLTVFDMFPNETHTTRFNRTLLWKHCIQCGLLARLLVSRSPRCLTEPEDAFCTGLLHDIGKVVMEQFLHDDFANALNYAETNHTSFIKAEIGHLPFTHTQVAGWLLTRWDLPENLLSSIVYHHNPSEAKEYKGSVYLCHFADYLTYSRHLNESNGITPPPLAPETQSVLGLTDEAVDEVVAGFQEQMAKTNPFYELLT
jgi:HD-like signal output (HDOD) protein